MSRGDWALVAFYADKIREIKVGGDVTSNSRAIVPASRPPPIRTTSTNDSSILSKKTILTKLVEAEKWKGVSIMAGLYEMEAKGSLSTTPSQS